MLLIPKPFRIVLIPILAVLLLGTCIGIINYPGEWYVFLIFSITCNILLFMGLTSKAIFFDAFIGLFFWLGFWLKTTFSLIFFNGSFRENTGHFNGTGDAFDRALLVVVVAFLGLLIARWARQRWLFNYQEHREEVPGSVLKFYEKYRKTILFLFVISFLAIGISNAYWGIYQRGEIPKTTMPFGLGGIYTWLLLFGLASFTALILRFELALNSTRQYVVAFIALLEVFVSNVSLLSRGMLLNVSALFYGFYKLANQARLKINLKQSLVILTVFIVLFAISVVSVNYLRYSTKPIQLAKHEEQTPEKLKYNQRYLLVTMTSSLFVDRWVGIEGVLAISSSNKLGWDLWNRAWQERYSNYETSFYDLNLIESIYKRIDRTKQHYISLPGVLAFLFYPGSYTFLFLAMIFTGLIGAMIELAVYKLGGKNLILCALISQVVAFRLASFGYVPRQSYLLMGAIFLNLMLIYLITFLINKFFKANSVN